MTPAYLYFLPLGGAFIALMTAIPCCYWLRKCYMTTDINSMLVQEFLGSVDRKKMFTHLWDEMELDEEIGSLIDRHLDQLIAAFKVQIPMIGSVLSTQREDKLKQQAHVELMKLIPAMKQKILDLLERKDFSQISLDSLICSEVTQATEKATNRFIKTMAYSFLIKSAILGFILGILEMGIMMILTS